eukprot:scaffold51514_cov64-Phaeocystis_antarctica.AAC.2
MAHVVTLELVSQPPGVGGKQAHEGLRPHRHRVRHRHRRPVGTVCARTGHNPTLIGARHGCWRS